MKEILNLINKNKKIFIIVLIVILLLRIIYSIYIFNFKYSNKNLLIKEVFVLELVKKDEEKASYLVKYDNSKFLLNIYSKEENKENIEYKYGDVLRINGKLSEIEVLKNPNEFNYKVYLNSNNIVGNIYATRVNKIKEKNGIWLVRVMNSFKSILNQNITENMQDSTANLLKSMLYGDDKNLADNIKENFDKNGLSHILAVSGSNISYIVLIVEYVLNKNKEKSKNYSLNIIIIILFCILSSFSISILRASIMAIISILNSKYNLKLKKYTSVIISLYILVIYNPFVIFNMSCIFSYLAVISIMIYQNEIYSYIDICIKKIVKYDYCKNSCFKKYIYYFFANINKILAVYISVQILILPIQIYYFSKIEFISIFSNILFYPIIFISLLIACLIIFFVFVPVVSTILFNLEESFLKLIIYLVEFFAKLNISVVIPKPSITIILVYYILLIIFRVDKKVILVVKKSKIKIIKSLKYIMVSIYFLYIIFNYIYVCYFDNYVYYFNVEQGNMAFIRYNRKNILIDCGSTTTNLAENILENFCKEKGITKIDLCVITHFHDDHMNLLLSNNLEISIEKIIYAMPKIENENFVSIKKIANNNISMIEVELFDIYEFEGIKIYILSPSKNKKVIAEDIENANSMVVLVAMSTTNLLFMGDATNETEEEIIKNLEKLQDNVLKCDIKEKLQYIKCIQLGHHGSKTSSSEKFLESIKVENAVISAEKEKFGHPHNEVLDRLEKRNIKALITENIGSIKFKIK